MAKYSKSISKLINISDLIPAIYICTVENNDKRHLQMKHFIDKLNIPPHKIHWNIVPRMHKGTQQLSSTDNHLLAMKDALKLKYKYVLIFEDDLYLRNDIDLDKCIRNLNTFLTFWNHQKYKDIIYLGHLPWKLPILPDKYSVVKSLGQCIQAYIINKNMMEDITNYSCEDICNKTKKHWTASTCGYALDTFITVGVREKRYRSYAFYPQFIMQDSIKGYEEWSVNAENICAMLGTWINLFYILIVFIILYMKEKNKYKRYIYFSFIIYFTHLLMKLIRK